MHYKNVFVESLRSNSVVTIGQSFDLEWLQSFAWQVLHARL